MPDTLRLGRSVPRNHLPISSLTWVWVDVALRLPSVVAVDEPPFQYRVGRIAEDHVVGDLLDVGRRREAARLVEHRGERLQGAELGRGHAADRGVLQDRQHPVIAQRIVGGELLGDAGGDAELPQQRDDARRAGRRRRLFRGRIGGRPLGAVVGLDADRFAAGAGAGDILKLGELRGGQSVPRAIRELDAVEDEIAAVGAAVVTEYWVIERCALSVTELTNDEPEIV